MKQARADGLELYWSNFPLEQVNSKDDNFRLWETSKDYPSLGLLAFKASEAARHQGGERFDQFRMGLLRAKHVEGKNIADMETSMGVARAAGLDLDKFTSDMERPETLHKIKSDYTEAVEEYDAFGVPTLVFENGAATFVKLEAIPPSERECLDLFELVWRLGANYQYFRELKKPSVPK